jgi:hypothetical protein
MHSLITLLAFAKPDHLMEGFNACKTALPTLRLHSY